MSNNVEKPKSIEEMIAELPEAKQKILEQFREDLEKHPIRQLNKTERDIWGAAVTGAIGLLPSFRDAIAVLNPYMDATASTAYTDKHARVGLSYWFFYIADHHTRSIALLHESMHVLNSHFSRSSSKGIKPRMMNIAGDLEINSNLSLLPKGKAVLQNFLLPDHEMFDFPYFKTLEQYSILLQDKLNENEKEAEQNASGSKDSSQSDSNSGQNTDSSEQDSSSSSGSNSNDSGNSSENSSGSSSGSDSQGSESGQGQSSSGGQSGSQGSGYGSAYDSFVDDILGRKKQKGGGSLEDLLNEDEPQGSGKCNGNHSQSGDGSECDGSCEHDADGSGNSDNSGDGSSNSIDEVQKKRGNNKAPQRVKAPGYSCDRNTEGRSEAADQAGVDRSSVTEQNIARRNTSARVQEEVANKSRGTGTNDEFLKLLTVMMTPPKVNWQELFRRNFNAACNNAVRGYNHVSYKRIDRRSQGKIIFPGRVNYQPSAMLGIDTSGSMDMRDYEAVLTEAEGIMTKGLRSSGKLEVFSVDQKIQNIQPVKKVKDINLRGGGGTDMNVAFQYVNSLPFKQRPDIFVLGTDAGTYWESIIQSLRQKEATYLAIILVTCKSGFDNIPKEAFRYASIIDVSSGNSSW